MFAKLKRAKSFVHRTKREESDEREEVLSETAHLRRNISINHVVLEKHKKLCMSNESLNTLNRQKLQRQTSESQEQLQDDVIEQLRKLNFGDSYSRKAIPVACGSPEPSEAFIRRHPAYISDRSYHRKSFGTEKGDKHSRSKPSGDVVKNFDRMNRVNSSERVKNASFREESNFAFRSEDDFLLRRKGLDTINRVTKRTPGYVPETSRQRNKTDILEKTGLRSFFYKFKGHEKERDSRDISDSGFSTGSSTASYSAEGTNQSAQYRRKDNSEKSSRSGNCSNTSTVSSSGSLGVARANFGKELKEERRTNVTKKQNESVEPKFPNINYFETNISKREVAYSATNRFTVDNFVHSVANNGHKSTSSEDFFQGKVLPVQPSQNCDVLRGSEELSRKRQHSQTKSSFGRGHADYLSQTFDPREPRKKTGIKLKENGDPQIEKLGRAD